MKWITALNLESWASTIGSRTALSELVSSLIRASVTDISSIRFPSGDSAQIPGYDGRLICTDGSLYVPEGESVWELGVDEDYLAKANDEYRKRSENPGPIDPKNNTFVFVTPRRWVSPKKTREIWIEEKLAEERWKDVRVVDAITLEDWLGLCEAVASRFAREALGLMPITGVRDTSDFWEEYAANFAPALTESVLLADRQRQADQLLSELSTGPMSSRWQADSAEEVVAFAVAAIRRAEPEVRKFTEARTLVIETVEAARQLVHKTSMVLLVKAGALSVAGRLAQGNLVIVPIGRDNPGQPGANLLERPTTEALATAIRTMGVAEERAHQLARNSGRSVTILARRIPSASAQKPEWAGQRPLIPALLAGGWSTRSEEDKKVIAALAGVKEYPDYEGELLPYLSMGDPPLDREGDVWKLRAPVDAFAYLGHLVGEKEIARLEEAVRTVFGEIDPSLDLPDEERPYAGIHGKNLKHSAWLRTGLATTLRIMAVLDLANPAIRPVQLVEKLVAELPGLSTDYHLIASLHGELPILMEAAPRPLLAALERMLEGGGKVLAPIFQDTDPLFSHSPHTGLLWALEALAWDPHYLSGAALTLAKLARIDPGGKLMNRPINSLREIFLTWHPGTNATLVQRLATLDQVIAKEPGVGWELLVMLFPGQHDVASPTAKPRYREAGESEKEVLTYALVAQGHREIVERAFKLANADPERWVTLIKELSILERAQWKRVPEILKAAAQQMPQEGRSKIWSALRAFVARHKAFPTAPWALPDVDLAPFQDLVTELEPTDPVKRLIWLFDDYHPAIPKPETGTFDLADKARESAIRDLLAKGDMDSLLKLADLAEHTELVAVAYGSVLGTVEEFAALVDATMGKTDNLATFASVLSAQAERKLGSDWHTQIIRWRSQRPWTEKQFADLVLNWKDARTTWDFLLTIGPDVNRSYWERKRPWSLHGNEADDLEMAANAYLAVGRATAAIQALHFSAKRMSADTLFKMLDAAVGELNAFKARLTNEFVYDLGQIFDSLQQRSEIPSVEIAKREYAYLPLFEYRDRQLTLHQVMAEDPRFYASLLRDAFKPKNREVPEPTEEQRGVARAAYRLLSEFRVLPGTHEGQIDPQALSAWVEEVRRLAKEDDRSAIGDEFIGHLLAHAPHDPDGAWPHRTVRELIEKVASNELELGIEVERFNMRGAHARAMYGGGEPERAIAAEVREWAKKTQAWPRTKSMLERIAQSWEMHAQQQDERANQDKMRYE